jgi:hypothetical protein
VLGEIKATLDAIAAELGKQADAAVQKTPDLAARGAME